MTREEFTLWKQSYVTQEVFKLIREAIAEGTEELVNQAGSDPIRDRYVVGKLRGLQDVLDLTVDEDNVPIGEPE